MQTENLFSLRNVLLTCIVIFISLCTFSCKESAKERQQRETIDSLENVNAQGRMNYDDLQNYLTIISEGLDSISLEEKEILKNPTPGEGKGLNKQRMRQQLMHVREILNRHRSRINELEQKLAVSTGDAKKLHTIVVALKQQLAAKDAELEQLRADLDDSRKSVAELQNKVSRMQIVQDEQSSTIDQQQTTIQEQKDQMSTAYVKIATKKQLKSEGLLSGAWYRKKKVDYSNINTSKFEAIDIRKTKTLSVPNGSKVLTPVPKGSYTIDNGTLTILNSDQFWSISNILIIQTD